MDFLIIPIAYFIGVLTLFVTGKRRGLAFSLLFFGLAVLVGWGSIMQSRSSTAGISVLLLPFTGVLAGVLAWVFRNLQLASHAALRLLGWICLAAACLVIAWEVNQGMKTIELNRTRDAQQQARSARIERNRSMIAANLLENKGQESAALDRLIHSSGDDPEILLPALESKFASPETLDRFARADDLGITLTAIRNPNCRADTLVRIYRTHRYPDYFLQALVTHPHTPPEILREIYQKPRRISGLDIWFAKNPNTPADILLKLSDSQDVNVIRSLLQNPMVDCTMLNHIAATLKRFPHPEDNYSVSTLAGLKTNLCMTPTQ